MNTNKRLAPDFSMIPQPNSVGTALDLTPGGRGASEVTPQITQRALHQLSAIEIYSFQRLVAEMQRQAQLLPKGGDDPEQQRGIEALMLACAAELRAVSQQLNARLWDIVCR